MIFGFPLKALIAKISRYKSNESLCVGQIIETFFSKINFY